MRKLTSIGISFIMLAASMHITFAHHYCGGKIAASRISFSGKLATCGMNMDAHKASDGEGLASNCCKDVVAVYALDDNYSQPFFKVQSPLIRAIHPSFDVTSLLIPAKLLPHGIASNTGPPGYILNPVTSRNYICVFRI